MCKMYTLLFVNFLYHKNSFKNIRTCQNEDVSFPDRICRDRAEGGAGGALAPPLFCKNKNKFNKK